ncbi:UDP-glycosyltransferase 86A1-like [Sesamum indicum]|uniref:UDP-glycosyltransferase 86A1-like n=1 Tax=Sesamum indicum TaxID=4182 RepID=A0A6I9UAH9_SESIN|nr:UDP-glycosyltransferase 86A1-like [Sesamum indicum]
MGEKFAVKPHAIMISVPYQGHANPFTHLAIKLASKGFTITFVHTQDAHHRISKSYQKLNSTSSSDEVDIFSEARDSGLDIRYTTIADGFPLEFDRDQNVNEYWESILHDFPSRVDEFIGNLIESFDPELLPFLVADAIYPWPATIAKKYNLVNVSFWTGPAAVLAINYYFFDHLRANGHFPPTDDPLYSIDYIPGVESISSKDLMPYLREADTTTIVHKVLLRVFEEVKKADFILHNTLQELEQHTLSTLNQKQPTYAIGPVSFSPDCIKTRVSKSLLFEIDCSKWLGSKPPSSVLYVSFGSNVPTNKQVIEAIAQGLLLSEVSFIWVIRPKIVRSIDDNKNVLPAGFEDNLKDKGLVVPWCDQNAVFSNPAVGGFLTHCGWNSILESMWYGIPLICYPIMYDQPTNRKLVVDDWKIGVNLCDGVSVDGAEIALKIKQLMCEKTSIGIRNEIMKFRSVLHDALSEEGSSNRNFDQFIQDLRHKMHVGKENVSSTI